MQGRILMFYLILNFKKSQFILKLYQFSFNTEINWFQLNVQDDDVNIQKKWISYMYAQSHHER